MQMFIERQLGSGVDVMDVGSPNKSSDDTMILATKARMLAWIDTFLPPEGEKRLDSITCSVTSLRMLFKEHIKEELGGGGGGCSAQILQTGLVSTKSLLDRLQSR